MFQNTLDDIPHKWYKIEEESGHTFVWNEIKRNFLKYFQFRIEEKVMQATTKEIKSPLRKSNSTERKGKGKIKQEEKLRRVNKNLSKTLIS